MSLRRFRSILFIFTIFETVLFKVRSALPSVQCQTQSESVKYRIDSNSNSSLTGKRVKEEGNFAVAEHLFLFIRISELGKIAIFRSICLKSLVPDSLF